MEKNKLKHEMVYTAAEVALILRESPASVKEKLESGEIVAYREGTGWKVPKHLLRVYIENKGITETQERRRLHQEMK